MSVIGELDDALLEVVIDLVFQFMLDFLFDVIRVRDAKVVIVTALLFEEVVMFCDEFFARVLQIADSVPVNPWSGFEGLSKGRVGGAPYFIRHMARGDSEEGKRHIRLLIETE